MRKNSPVYNIIIILKENLSIYGGLEPHTFPHTYLTNLTQQAETSHPMPQGARFWVRKYTPRYGNKPLFSTVFPLSSARLYEPHTLTPKISKIGFKGNIFTFL